MTPSQLFGLSVYALILLSCVFEIFKQRKFSVSLLFVASLVAGYWAIGLDPFLNDWDERFHALVAKNLTYDMLHPTLFRTPLIPYDFKDWTGNHTWIHKQPMFLWIISLSIKIFGATEISVRLPSMLMVSVMTLMMYRMGRLLSNERSAFIAALLMACHYTYLQNMSGIFLVDHNNIAFLFFVTLSFFCWIEYEFSGKRRWLLGMGAAVGCAVLVKWLVGLLVLAPFAVHHLFIRKDMFSKRMMGSLVQLLLVILLVAIPWQLYCYLRFPKEFLFEMSFNAKHIWQALEGHAESRDFYLRTLTEDFKGLYVLVVPSILSLLLIRKNHWLNQLLLFAVVLIYLFFTMVATKMPQYIIIASPFILYGMALFADKVLSVAEEWFSGRIKYASPVLFLGICLLFAHLNFSFKTVEGWHWRDTTGESGRYKEYKIYCKQYFKELAKTYNPQTSVIIFCSQNIDCMFYTDFTAYYWVEEKDVKLLRESGRKILVFNTPVLPEYIRKDSSLVLLNNEVLQ